MFKFNEFLFEMAFESREVEYTILYKSLGGKMVEVYRFLSKNGTSYDVCFALTTEDDEELPNGDKLSDYTELDKIPTIFFSLTNRGFGEDYNDLSNKFEQFDILSKIVYIIGEYMNTHNYTVYTVGGVEEQKMKFYLNYMKHFNDYKQYDLPSKNYSVDGGKTMAKYLIKNI